MKQTIKLFAAALILSLTAFVANAQNSFGKSDKIVEGSASYTKVDGSDAAYSIQPTVGYFLTDKFAVGVALEAGKDAAGDKTTGVGAYGRCYFLSIGKNFKTFSQLSIGSSTTDVAGVKTSTFGTSIDLGANYFVSKNLALCTGLTNIINYTSVKSSSTFSIGWNGVSNPLNAATFGVLYRF